MSQAVSVRSRQQLHMAQMLQQLQDPAQPALQRQAIDEAMVFHLYGALQNFLQELNELFVAGVFASQISPQQMAQALKAQGRASPAINELLTLANDEHSWYSLLCVKYNQISQVQQPEQNTIVATVAPALQSQQLSMCIQSMQTFIERARDGMREY